MLYWKSIDTTCNIRDQDPFQKINLVINIFKIIIPVYYKAESLTNVINNISSFPLNPLSFKVIVWRTFKFFPTLFFKPSSKLSLLLYLKIYNFHLWLLYKNALQRPQKNSEFFTYKNDDTFSSMLLKGFKGTIDAL